MRRLALAMALLCAPPALADDARARALDLRRDGARLLQRDDFRASLDSFSRAEALLRGGAETYDDWLVAADHRLRLLGILGRTREALEAARDTAARIERIAGADSADASIARLIVAKQWLANDRRSEAARLVNVEAGRIAAVRPTAALSGYFHDVAASVYIAHREYAKALDSARTSLGVYERFFPNERLRQIDPTRKIVLARLELTDRAVAELAARRAIELAESVFAPNHPEVAHDLAVYARVLRDGNRGEEAARVQRRVAAIYAGAYGEAHPAYARSLVALATTLMARDEAAEAASLLRRAADAFRAAEGFESESVDALVRLGGAMRALGKPVETIRHFAEADKVMKARPGASVDDETSALLSSNGAAAYFDLGRYDLAWENANLMLRAAEGRRHGRSVAAALNRVRLVAAETAEKRGETGQALTMTREAGENARAIGQTDRVFLDDWAGLLARYAWKESR
jgi:hypothetical protein